MRLVKSSYTMVYSPVKEVIHSMRSWTISSYRYTKHRITITVSSLYSDISYNSKIRYNVNLVCTKISGSCTFSLTIKCYSLGKHTFWTFVRIASARRGNSNKYTKRMFS